MNYKSYFVRSQLVMLFYIGFFGQMSAAADPTCEAFAQTHPLPLIPSENHYEDLGKMILGNDLSYQISTKNQTNVTVTDKLTKLDQMTSTMNIISNRIEKSQSAWGDKSFTLYLNSLGSIFLSYGIMRNSSQVPRPSSVVLITAAKNERCFDTAFFEQQNLVIVDCAKFNEKEQPTQNIFIYVDIGKSKILKKEYSAFEGNFTSLTDRKILQFNQTSLLRAYLAEGVDAEHRSQNYLCLFSYEDSSLILKDIITAQQLWLESLQISQIKKFKERIFIIDERLGMIEPKISPENTYDSQSYRIKGFTRFAVYDPQGVTTVVMVGANTIIEIGWDLLTTFSTWFFPNLNTYFISNKEKVIDAHVSQDFITVTTKHETLVVRREAPSSGNIHTVIKHAENSFTDVNSEINTLLIMDGNGSALYQLSKPKLKISFNNGQRIGQSDEIIITATSTNSETAQSVVCSSKITVNFISKETQPLYPLNLSTKKYSFNESDEIRVPINSLAIGTNILVKAINISSQSSSKPDWHFEKILQRDVVTLDSNFWMFTTFQMSENLFIQPSSTNQVLIYKCDDQQCWQDQKFQYQDSRLLMMRFFWKVNGIVRLMVYENSLNTVFGYWQAWDLLTMNITYEKKAVVKAIQVDEKNLFTIVHVEDEAKVYSYKVLSCLDRQCQPTFVLDENKFKEFGIKKCGAEKIFVNEYHRNTLFVQCSDDVVALDTTNASEIRLIGKIPKGDSFAVYKDHLVVAKGKGNVTLYGIEDIKTRHQINEIGNLPLYSYEIASPCSLAFFETIYIVAIDTKMNRTVILIYQPNLPTALSLHHVIILDALYPSAEIMSTVIGRKFYAKFPNALYLRTDNKFQKFELIKNPQLVIENPVPMDLKFQIQLSNFENKKITELNSVEAVKDEKEIKPTEQMKKTFANLTLSAGKHQWQNSQWFTGSNLFYNISCDQCEEKVIVKPNIEKTMQISDYQFIDYYELKDGSSIGLNSNNILYIFSKDKKLLKYIPIPPDDSYCTRVVMDQNKRFAVIGCFYPSRLFDVPLFYIISDLLSENPTTSKPFLTTMVCIGDFSLIGDYIKFDNICYSLRQYTGPLRVYLLKVAYSDEKGRFQLLQSGSFDESVFSVVEGVQNQAVKIRGTQLHYSTKKDLYRLIATESSGNLIIMEFKDSTSQYNPNHQVEVTRIFQMSFKNLLESQGINVPYSTFALGCVIAKYEINNNMEKYYLFLPLQGFNNFMISLTIENYQLQLLQTFHQYSDYSIFGKITANENQIIVQYKDLEKQKSILIIYDSSQIFNNQSFENNHHYALGGLPLARFQDNNFYFGFSANQKGFVLFEKESNVKFYSFTNTFSIEVKEGFRDQDLTIVASNGFSSYTFKVPIRNQKSLILEMSALNWISLVTIAAIVISFSIFIKTRNRKIIQIDENLNESLKETINTPKTETTSIHLF